MTDTDPHRPAPRPRPRPGADDAATPAQTATPQAAAPTGRRRARHGRHVRPERSGAAGPANDARRVRRLRRVMMVGGAIFVAAAVAAAVLWFVRDDDGGSSATATGAAIQNPDAAQAFLGGAASDLAAVTSYDYRDLDAALANGSAVTTGSYRSAYRAALSGSLGATARRDHVVQQFQVQKVGIGTVSDDGSSAAVLAFGTRTVTQQPGGTGASRTATQAVTLRATVVRDGSRYLISALDQDANAGLPPGNAALDAAAEAARTQVVDLLSFRRASFAADTQRAVGDAAGPLRTQISQRARTLRSQLTSGRYDLSGEVTAVAVGSVAPDTVTMLVAATGRKVPATGSPSVVTVARYVVAVSLVNGSWLATSVTPVGT